jgi:carboxyl-terminal processing protease
VKRRLLVPLVAVLVIVALVAGIYAGGHPSSLPAFARNTLVGDGQAQIYNEALKKIAHDYYRPVNKRSLLDSSLTAAVAALHDRFSHYIDPHQYEAFEESTSGSFQGVGLNVAKDRAGLRVLQVFSGGPAAKAGIQRGDRIVAVNGHSLKGHSSDDATNMIKGPSGTSVRLTIVRDGKRRTVAVQRASVSVPVAQGRMEHYKRKRIAYVSLAQFTSGAHGFVSSKVRDLLRRGAGGVVLDLRGNGGGLLQEGVLVASVFIPQGTIVTTRGRSRPSQTYTATGDAIPRRIPMAVLVDGGTASASEIVTGALQDRHRATVVGTRTFGKGVFQEIENLSNGGALDITVGQYYTPDNRNLGPHDGKPGGIVPDVHVADNPRTPGDEALKRALGVVAGRM